MNHHRLNLALILVVVSFAFFFYMVYAYAEPASDSPVLDTTTKATSRYLPVTFDSHGKHAKDYNIGCTKCHHDISNDDETPASCKTCHDKADSDVDMKKAMHTNCLGCHKCVVAKNAASKAPVKCLACHKERK